MEPLLEVSLHSLGKKANARRRSRVSLKTKGMREVHCLLMHQSCVRKLAAVGHAPGESCEPLSGDDCEQAKTRPASMNCIETQERLSPFYDSELSAVTGMSVAERLRGCTSCVDLLNGFRKMRNSLLAGPMGPVPETVWKKLGNQPSCTTGPSGKLNALMASMEEARRFWATRRTFYRLAIEPFPAAVGRNLKSPQNFTTKALWKITGVNL